MVPRIERIAKTGKVTMGYWYNQNAMQDRNFRGNKKKKPQAFKKVLNNMMEDSAADSYKVEIDAGIH